MNPRPSPRRSARGWFELYRKELFLALGVVLVLLLCLGFFQYRAYQQEVRNGAVTYLNAWPGTEYALWLTKEAAENPRPPMATPGLTEGVPAWTAGTDHPAPRAGDVVVNSRGETVALEETVTEDGVYLGVGQGVDLYGGMIDSRGNMVKDGYRGPLGALYGLSDRDVYVVDERTGEGRFRSEWEKLRADRALSPAARLTSPQEGLYDGEVYLYRVWNAEEATWYWKGPLFFWFFA